MNEASNMSKQSAVSPDSSVDYMVSDAKTEIVGWSHNIVTKQQPESTDSVMTHGDSDSLSHPSYALTQQEEFLLALFRDKNKLCFLTGFVKLVAIFS